MQLKLENIIEKVFYITIGIYFFLSAMTITMLQYEDISSKAKVIRYICYFIFLLVILFHITKSEEKMTIKLFLQKCWDYACSHLILMIMLFLTFIIMIQMGDKLPFILVFLVWASSFYDFKKILRIYIGTTATLMLITFGLTYKGMLINIITERADNVRYSMGYIYPLELMAHFLILMVSYFYVSGKKLEYRELIFINITNFLLYIITDSRTSFYLGIATSIIVIIYAKTSMDSIFKYISFKIYDLFLVLCSLGSIIIGFLYTTENPILQKLDTLFSGRIILMNNAFQKYGITLFGQKIEWVGFGAIQWGQEHADAWASYNFVDNAYAKLLLDYGIVFFVLVIIGYAIIYKTANEQKDYMLIIIISVILVLSIMEPRLVSIEMNPFVLLLGRFFMMETSKKCKNAQINTIN